MLKTLAHKLTGNPGKAAEAFERTKGELTAALAKLQAAKEAWEEAVSNEAEAPSADPSQIDKFESEMNTAQREVTRLQAAQKGLEGRILKAVADAKRLEAVEKWRKAEALAEARSAAASRLVKSMESFAKDYLEFLKATGDLNGAIPEKPDMEAARLLKDPVENSVRQQLLKLGVEWASNWPWGTVSLPDFLPPYQETPKLIQQWRDSSLARR